MAMNWTTLDEATYKNLRWDLLVRVEETGVQLLDLLQAPQWPAVRLAGLLEWRDAEQFVRSHTEQFGEAGQQHRRRVLGVALVAGNHPLGDAELLGQFGLRADLRAQGSETATELGE